MGLLPPILTCALARRLGCSSSSNNNSNNNSSSINSNNNNNSNSNSNSIGNDGNNTYHGGENHDNDHWTLRCTSATAAAEIADRYGMEYTSLRGRLLVPFSEALLKELQPPLPPAKIRTHTTTNNNTAATTTQAASQVNPNNNTMTATAAAATTAATATT